MPNISNIMADALERARFAPRGQVKDPYHYAQLVADAIRATVLGFVLEKRTAMATAMYKKGLEQLMAYHEVSRSCRDDFTAAVFQTAMSELIDHKGRLLAELAGSKT